MNIIHYTLFLYTPSKIVAEKETVHWIYRGEPGYMPIVGHLAETGLVVGNALREGCALQAHEMLSPEMAVLAKPSQRPSTESCVVSGNGHCEA